MQSCLHRRLLLGIFFALALGFAPGAGIVARAQDNSKINQINPDTYQLKTAPTNAILMPDVVGLTVAEAEKAVLSAGKIVGVRSAKAIVVGTVASAAVPKGRIVRQGTQAGSPLVANLRDVGGTNGRVTFKVYVSAGYPLPDYRKRTIDVVEADAKKLGFRLQRTARRDLDVAQGVILDQSPAPGTLLPLNGPVSVTVSNGWPVPDFTGMTEEKALLLAKDNRIRLKVAEGGDSQTSAGLISDQKPQKGEPVPADRVVSVTVSQVAQAASTPDLIGKSEQEALAIAADEKIRLVRARDEENFAVAAGRVFQQEPEAAAALPANRIVTVSYSLGWPVAPDAVGEAADKVAQAYKADHPNAQIDIRKSPFTLKPAGTVLSQKPAAGVKLDAQQRLRLVSAGEKPVWFWPAGGLIVLGALGGLAAMARPRRPASRSKRGSPHTNELDAVRLRVVPDPGEQSITLPQDEGRQ